MTVRVVAWPSGRSGWSVHIGRPDAVEGETNYPVSLSPDGSMLAVSTSHELRVYGSDGVLRWTRPLAGLDVLGGPAAWRTDGRLAVMHRSPVSSWAVPGDWTVTYVDGRTGEPRPGPGLPTVRSVFALRIVAWRGGTAYAIARTSTGRPGSEIHASLVRLAPGGSGPEPLLSPDRVEDLGIATDYADATRPAGSPSYGFSLLGTVSLAYGYAWPATMVVGGAVLVWWLRRRRLERGRMRPAPVTGPSGSGTGTAR